MFVYFLNFLLHCFYFIKSSVIYTADFAVLITILITVILIILLIIDRWISIIFNLLNIFLLLIFSSLFLYFLEFNSVTVRIVRECFFCIIWDLHWIISSILFINLLFDVHFLTDFTVYIILLVTGMYVVVFTLGFVFVVAHWLLTYTHCVKRFRL